ncbi:hypothetical protein ACFT0G_06080 [Streptomyces sp. NPDC057020]|uniref:hypothetical protein n=1 Tax=unclassified Streptomyces TaxID=2593676 RepID=UPI00363C7DB2
MRLRRDEVRERPCAVCLRKSRAALDRALATGTMTPSGAAAAFGVTEGDLRYHIEACGVEVWSPREALGPADSPEAIMRTVMQVCGALMEMLEKDSKPGYVIKAAAELTKLLELRARAGGLFQNEGAAEGIAAMLATETFAELVTVTQTSLAGDDETRARLLAALEAVDQAPGEIPANVAPAPAGTAHVRERWTGGG